MVEFGEVQGVILRFKLDPDSQMSSMQSARVLALGSGRVRVLAAQTAGNQLIPLDCKTQINADHS
jgi:hypothetical protein